MDSSSCLSADSLGTAYRVSCYLDYQGDCPEIDKYPDAFCLRVQLNILFATSYGQLLAAACPSEHLANVIQVRRPFHLDVQRACECRVHESIF